MGFWKNVGKILAATTKAIEEAEQDAFHQECKRREALGTWGRLAEDISTSLETAHSNVRSRRLELEIESRRPLSRWDAMDLEEEALDLVLDAGA